MSQSQRWRISHGSTFEEQVGYSRAVVADPWVFVAGTTGFDYSEMTISEDIVEQVEQTLANIDAALAEAGASAPDIVRARYYLPTGQDFEARYPSLRRYFGAAPPAAIMVICDLLDPRIKIEIEVTALKQQS